MNTGKNTHIRFQRSNYVVTDLERALTFYRDVLGFTLNFTKDSPDDSYSYPVFRFNPQKKLRFAVLDAPDQPRVMALTEVVDETFAEVPFPRRSAIVLEVGNVDAVVQGSKSLGLEVVPEEKLVTHDGRVGREVGIVDWDGNLTVIYHIPPKEPSS